MTDTRRQKRLDTLKTALQAKLGLDFPPAWRKARAIFEADLPAWDKAGGIPSPYAIGEAARIRARIVAEFPRLHDDDVQLWMQCVQLYRAMERAKRA